MTNVTNVTNVYLLTVRKTVEDEKLQGRLACSIAFLSGRQSVIESDWAAAGIKLQCAQPSAREWLRAVSDGVVSATDSEPWATVPASWDYSPYLAERVLARLRDAGPQGVTWGKLRQKLGLSTRERAMAAHLALLRMEESGSVYSVPVGGAIPGNSGRPGVRWFVGAKPDGV